MGWSTRSYIFEEVFPLDRHSVWELLADTDHLNRFIGLFRLTPSPLSPGGLQPIRRLEGRKFGIPIVWREYPFEWEKYRFYDVIRAYDSGPFRRFRGGVELEDAPLPDGKFGGTLVRLYAEFTPASPIGIAAAVLTGKGAMKRTMDYIRTYLTHQARGAAHVLPALDAGQEVQVKELDRLLDELSRMPVQRELLPALRATLLESGADEAAEIRPYEWSDRVGCERMEAVQLFLYATKVGLFDMGWHLLCPSCRGGADSVSTLRELAPSYHCDFCGIPYEVELDRYVELVFSVHPKVRRAYKSVYCVGGPSLSPHVLAQMNLAAGEARRMPLGEGDAARMLRVLRLNHRAPVAEEGEPASIGGYALRAGGWIAIDTPMEKEGDTAGSILVRNDTEQDVTVVLEKSDWEDRYLTAAKVTALSEFRGLFSSEVLSPGMQVGIRSLAVLFSDLRGSTAFYSRTGDAHAYSQVRNHFTYMSGWIAKHNGALVKTIGDAVMAVFETPELALEAALDIQRGLDSYNEALAPDDRLEVKLGFHAGPVIAVNSNDRLDYFGQTVNLAARIQAASDGGDVVIAEGLAEQLVGLAELLETCGWRMKPFRKVLKETEGELQLVRLTPADSAE